MEYDEALEIVINAAKALLNDDYCIVDPEYLATLDQAVKRLEEDDNNCQVSLV